MSEQAQKEVSVRCVGLTKRYLVGETVTVALRGIDLEAYRGELLMLVGPSGCGKTTLISIIAGILNQDEGTCTVLGRSVREISEREKTRFRGDNVGFVFQALNLIPTLTAIENVAIPLLLQDIPRKEALARAQAVLASLGLGDRGDSLPSQLSGGQQQRVAIARALVHSPRLIVCDEPTSALDHTTGARIMEIFRDKVVAADRTLIIVTHDARIFPFADRIARMDDGRVEEILLPTEMQI